jgi:hypothetical protein
MEGIPSLLFCPAYPSWPSLFAHDSERLVERRGRSAKQSSIRVAQGKDQIGGARNRD